MLWINALRSGRGIFESTRNLGLNLFAGICKEPQLEGDHGNLGMYGLRPQQMASVLLETSTRLIE